MAPDVRAANEAAGTGAATLELGGRTFAVAAPTLEDYFAARAEARRQCMAGAGDPLDLVNDRIAKAEKEMRPLSPTMVTAMVREAMASAGGKDKKTEPTDAQVMAQAATPDMMRWWCWWLVRKADAAVTPAQVAGWVPDDAVAAVSKRIGELMGMGHVGPKSPASPT